MAYLTDEEIIFDSGRSVPVPGAGGFIGINKDLWIGAGYDMPLISPNTDPTPGQSPISNEVDLTAEEIVELAECMIKYWTSLIGKVSAHGLDNLRLSA